MFSSDGFEDVWNVALDVLSVVLRVFDCLRILWRDILRMLECCFEVLRLYRGVALMVVLKLFLSWLILSEGNLRLFCCFEGCFEVVFKLVSELF